MRLNYLLRICVFAFPIFLSGCAVLEDSYAPIRQLYKPLEAQLGEERSLDTLPIVKHREYPLGRILQANGKTLREDGTYENAVGSGDCLFAFRVDSRTITMIGWRLAGKSDPSQC